MLNSIFLEKFQKIKPEWHESAVRSRALFFIIGILENTDKKAKLPSLEELITKKSIELSMRQQVEQRCRKVHCTFSVILEQSEANMPDSVIGKTVLIFSAILDIQRSHKLVKNDNK